MIISIPFPLCSHLCHPSCRLQDAKVLKPQSCFAFLVVHVCFFWWCKASNDDGLDKTRALSQKKKSMVRHLTAGGKLEHFSIMLGSPKPNSSTYSQKKEKKRSPIKPCFVYQVTSDNPNNSSTPFSGNNWYEEGAMLSLPSSQVLKFTLAEDEILIGFC